MSMHDNLPQRGDSIFKSNPTGEANADLTFLKSDKYLSVVAGAYKEAGDGIINHFGGPHEWYKQPELFMPAMLCYRHYVELAIKWYLGGSRNWGIGSLVEKDLFGHELQPLWDKLQPYLKEVWPAMPPEVLSGMNDLIGEMHLIDPIGENMRYVSTRKDNKHTLDQVPENVDMEHLQETMMKVWHFFERLQEEFHDWMMKQDWSGHDGMIKRRVDD